MIKVSEKLFRGCRPVSFQELKDKGVKTVINLQSGAHEFFKEDMYEKEKAENFGMSEVNIYCSDVRPPNGWEVMRFFNAVHSLPAPIYVHCLHGKDRTGYMCAAYQIAYGGYSFKAAVKEMFEHGFHKIPYLWWVPFLRKYQR